MRLLDLYIDRNKNKEWKEKYHSSSRDKRGTVYTLINTNFRTLGAYTGQFRKFERVEATDRSQWKLTECNQERDKQRVIPMLEAKIFQKTKKKIESQDNKETFLYVKTAKGWSYKRFVEGGIPDDSRWPINYLYLLDGVYGNNINHIAQRTKDILGVLDILEFEKENLKELFIKAINSTNYGTLLECDLFYILCFYDDIKFLDAYLSAREKEKKEMHEYIKIHRMQESKECCISHKTINGGSYSFPSAIDEIKIFYFTNILLRLKSQEIQSTLKQFINTYKSFFDCIDENLINSYLTGESDVIYSALSEVFGLEFEQSKFEYEKEDEEDISVDTNPCPFIDTTTKAGRALSNKIFNKMKGYARQQANYQCLLEESRGCKESYFTSKATGKNYVEVHHLIPREYSNRFESSIEVFSNYIVLCPSCHQLLHKASDRERKSFIRQLYADRKEELATMNLEIPIEELFAFYGIKE